MKIAIEERQNVQETEVQILCRKIDSEVSELIALVSGLGRRIIGAKNGRYYPVDATEILYAEAVERRTFLYTEADTLESALRLYELEELLKGTQFIRASKAILVNLDKIHSLEPTFGRRIEAVMQGGERVLFSRQYAAELKQKIDLR